jgi:alpha-ribazole phosphatase
VKIALLRHTAVEILPGTCYGRLDLPLAATAEGDIAEVVARLADFGRAALWCSPAARCRRLAAAIAPLAGAVPVFDDRLLELHLGSWEGRAWDEVPRAELDRWAADPLGFAAPEGESGSALVARVTAAFAAITAAPGDHIIITHGGPLRVLAALARGLPVDLLAPAPALGSVDIVLR